MGWLAAGGCTVLAGFILYKFVVRYKADDGSHVESKLGDVNLVGISEPAAEKGRPLPHTSSDKISDGPPTLMVPPPPRMQIFQTDSELTMTATKHADDEKKIPEMSMLPPPPPPAPKLNVPSSPPRLKAPAFSKAPPRPGNGFVRPPPSAAASLRVPVTKVLPNASLAPTSSIMPPGKQVSRKVILEPGHSPLDWAALINNPKSHLRGKDAPGESMLRITPSQLKKQNGRKGKDVWTVYQGKVYNITPYIPFHPGGAGEILRGSGKDSGKLFMEVHPWVNWDGMLGECMIGILVSEEERANPNAGGP